MSRDSEVSVICVVGKGRSGSTLLDRLLGQIDGFTSTGELWRVWDRGFHRGHSCGCGRPVPSCPRWRDVRRRLEIDQPLDLRGVIRSRDAVHRWRHVPGLLRAGSIEELQVRSPEAAQYARVLGRLYRSVADSAGVRVVVDSSKWPANPAVLGLMPHIRGVLVHLVRDPRAVAHSWTRHKELGDHPERAQMERFSPAFSALSWMLRTATTEIVASRTASGPALTVRYEDLIGAPAEVLMSIASAAGEQPRSLPIEGQLADLDVHHTISGNPDRHTTGRVELRLDDEWRQAMSPTARWTVTALCAPLLLRYDYPLTPAS